MTIPSEVIVQVLIGVMTTALVALCAYLWRIPRTLDKLTHAIDRIEELFNMSTKKMGSIEERLSVIDQLLSNLAGTSVSTKMIAEGKQEMEDLFSHYRRLLVKEDRRRP